MARGSTATTRCLAVWLAATGLLALGVRLAGSTALTLGRAATWQRSFEDLLVAVCATALLACGLRLWFITTATTVGLVQGRPPARATGLTRRLVLVACGAAVVAGATAPAMAAHGGDGARLAGLPLPDRATATAHPDRPAASTRPDRPARTADHAAPAEVVVRSGDSLWSLAAARLPASAAPADIDRAWREVYAANRAEVGPDPGLIRPGQRLRMPGTGPDGRR